MHKNKSAPVAETATVQIGQDSKTFCSIVFVMRQWKTHLQQVLELCSNPVLTYMAFFFGFMKIPAKTGHIVIWQKPILWEIKCRYINI